MNMFPKDQPRLCAREEEEEEERASALFKFYKKR